MKTVACLASGLVVLYLLCAGIEWVGTNLFDPPRVICIDPEDIS